MNVIDNSSLAKSYEIKNASLFDFDNEFYRDVVRGLSQPVKQLPCKYFYDERGSILFTEICNTDEYYITRTELALLDNILPEVAQAIGGNATIIEYGSGEGRKIRDLLAALHTPKAYVPIDISREILLKSTGELKRRFPRINIYPVVADYSEDIHLPPQILRDLNNRRVVFFPGSTISNFTPTEAQSFLNRLKKLLQPRDGLLIGVDLLKSPDILHRAYNDKKGVTAEFNLNILRRINDELTGDFDPGLFEHYAYFNPVQSRVEMHLVSLADQQVHIGDQSFHFRQGETIHTENSYKYSVDGFSQLAQTCGLQQENAWVDARNLFSIQYFTRR